MWTISLLFKFHLVRFWFELRAHCRLLSEYKRLFALLWHQLGTRILPHISKPWITSIWILRASVHSHIIVACTWVRNIQLKVWKTVNQTLISKIPEFVQNAAFPACRNLIIPSNGDSSHRLRTRFLG